MRNVKFIVFFLLVCMILQAQSIKPLYKNEGQEQNEKAQNEKVLEENEKPQKKSKKTSKKNSQNLDISENKTERINETAKASSSEIKNNIYATNTGVFREVSKNNLVPLWTEGSAKQILRVSDSVWYFVTSKGILYSNGLTQFELRNNGLPFYGIKKKVNDKFETVNEVQEIKDIAVNPLNPNELVTATCDTVFRTTDAGLTWTKIDASVSSHSGVKAVAVVSDTLNGESVIFMSHSLKGVSYLYPDRKNYGWNTVTRRFYSVDSSSAVDEISDILPVVQKTGDASYSVRVYLTQTFIPNLYVLDLKTKQATRIINSAELKGGFDSLCVAGDTKLEEICDIDARMKEAQRLEALKADGVDGSDSVVTKVESTNDNTSINVENPSIYYLSMNQVNEVAKKENTTSVFDKSKDLKKQIAESSLQINAAWFSNKTCGVKDGLLLNELWLLNCETVNNKYADKISDQKSLYFPSYQAYARGGVKRYKNLLKENNLNSIVIDMKDDNGLLRFKPNDPAVAEKSDISRYALDLDEFISEFKKENIYLIARVVVFKDKNLNSYNKYAYAIRSRNGNVWKGIQRYEKDSEDKSYPVYYDEAWVDPFCTDVWEYNVAVARELIQRGFDEIQFDYIRFPTDGVNLYDATFSWQEKGMNKESALIGFLSYARENINAPIGIDIYGASAWHRSGIFTMQNVEMLSEYVDVICPMLYPSHFENSFLNYEPYAERPYRIYYHGTLRNSIIARNKIVARPWVQSFFLNVPYDNQYYGKEYVKYEIKGIRDSIDRGYMYWNNAGNYSMVSADTESSSPTDVKVE